MRRKDRPKLLFTPAECERLGCQGVRCVFSDDLGKCKRPLSPMRHAGILPGQGRDFHAKEYGLVDKDRYKKGLPDRDIDKVLYSQTTILTPGKEVQD